MFLVVEINHVVEKLVMFFVVEPTHQIQILNLVWVLHLWLIIILLVGDFVNQS
jgi:hypothetical protein